MQHDSIAYHGMDILNLTAVATLSFSGMLDLLWQHLPGPTAVYMLVSALFMVFQVCDKMGWIPDRFRRRGVRTAEEN